MPGPSSENRDQRFAMRPCLRAVADPFREVPERDQVAVVLKLSRAEAIDRFQQRFQPEPV